MGKPVQVSVAPRRLQVGGEPARLRGEGRCPLGRQADGDAGQGEHCVLLGFVFLEVVSWCWGAGASGGRKGPMCPQRVSAKEPAKDLDRRGSLASTRLCFALTHAWGRSTPARQGLPSTLRPTQPATAKLPLRFWAGVRDQAFHRRRAVLRDGHSHLFNMGSLWKL